MKVIKLLLIGLVIFFTSCENDKNKYTPKYDLTYSISYANKRKADTIVVHDVVKYSTDYLNHKIGSLYYTKRLGSAYSEIRSDNDTIKVLSYILTK